MSTKSNLDRTNAEVLANAKKGRGRVIVVKLDPKAKAEMDEVQSLSIKHSDRLKVKQALQGFAGH